MCNYLLYIVSMWFLRLYQLKQHTADKLTGQCPDTTLCHIILLIFAKLIFVHHCHPLLQQSFNVSLGFCVMPSCLCMHPYVLFPPANTQCSEWACMHRQHLFHPVMMVPILNACAEGLVNNRLKCSCETIGAVAVISTFPLCLVSGRN